MRYQLRTLLFWLMLAPPLLAAMWICRPIAEAAIAALTERDWLWILLVTGIFACWWLRDRHLAIRMRAMAERIQRLRG